MLIKLIYARLDELLLAVVPIYLAKNLMTDLSVYFKNPFLTMEQHHLQTKTLMIRL